MQAGRGCLDENGDVWRIQHDSVEPRAGSQATFSEICDEVETLETIWMCTTIG